MKKIIFLFLISFSFQLKAQYCIPTYNPDPVIFIHNFNLGDIINRNSYADSATSYTFYQDITTSLELGRTYPMTASGETTAGITGDWAIWIDFNDDFTFSVDERIYYTLNTRWTSGMIEIPNDPSLLGEKRMRISYVWTSQDLDPCGDYSAGESEDYLVKFVDTPVDKDYYCMPFDAFNNDECIINDFSFGDIINLNSGSNDYNFSDYLETEFSGDFILGNTYDYSIASNSASNISGGFIAWLDYNDNQTFEESEIIIEDGPDILSTQGQITIPMDSSLLGKVKLRLRAIRSSNFSTDPCLFDNGTETEDYIINITTEPIVISTQDSQESIDVSIFPNPSSDILNIRGLNNGSYKYAIHNTLGQVEKTGQIDQELVYSINVQDLSSGMYILEINNKNKTKAIKFLKN